MNGFAGGCMGVLGEASRVLYENWEWLYKDGTCTQLYVVGLERNCKTQFMFLWTSYYIHFYPVKEIKT